MIAAVAALSVVSPCAARSGSRDEYEVKGAFLLNFVRLTEWPATAFRDPRQPVVLGVVGERDEARAIERLARDARVAKRPIEVERISTARQAARCHVLFVTASHAFRAGEMIRATHGGGVLTVGESEGFARDGGIIDLFTRDGKIHFAVNRRAAEAAGLRLSSKLLRFAEIVSSGGDRP